MNHSIAHGAQELDRHFTEELAKRYGFAWWQNSIFARTAGKLPPIKASGSVCSSKSRLQNILIFISEFRLTMSEVHFFLNGYINKENFPDWSGYSPPEHVQTLSHAVKLMVCCVLWAGGISDYDVNKNLKITVFDRQSIKQSSTAGLNRNTQAKCQFAKCALHFTIDSGAQAGK